MTFPSAEEQLQRLTAAFNSLQKQSDSLRRALDETLHIICTDDAKTRENVRHAIQAIQENRPSNAIAHLEHIARRHDGAFSTLPPISSPSPVSIEQLAREVQKLGHSSLDCVPLSVVRQAAARLGLQVVDPLPQNEDDTYNLDVPLPEKS